MNDLYPELYDTFQWLVPPQFSMAEACLYRWAHNPSEARRTAIVHEDIHGAQQVWSYAQLAQTTNRLANGLMRMGVQRGDRVAVVMGQHPETAATLMAIFGVGAVAVPLIPAMSTDQLAGCLNGAGVRVAVLDAAALPSILQVLPHCPQLRQLVGLHLDHESTISWRTLLARQPADFTPAVMRPTDPALLLHIRKSENYSAVLVPHQALIGNLPGFVAMQNWFPQPGDTFWTPLDWRLGSGLLCGLLPVMYFGKTIVSSLEPLSPASAIDLLQRYRISNALLTPPVLERLRQAVAPNEPLQLRAIALQISARSAGLHPSAREPFMGVPPNAFLATAETGAIAGMSHEKWPTPAGSVGRPYPGHRLAVLRPDASPCAANETGLLAMHATDATGHPDPALFSGYWQADGTLLPAVDHLGWHCTPYLASRDASGNLHLHSAGSDTDDMG